MVSVAAWIPDAPHGRSGSCKPRKCKLEEPHYSTNTWYFSRKEIEERSPSRRDGICLSIETYLRTLYCGFLQDLGKALKVSQITVATSIMFCHRFFLGQSHAKNDWQTVATACMFLAGKVEDTHVPLKYLSVVSHGIIYKTDPVTAERIKQWEYYIKQKELILLGERILLSTIGFDFNIMHPYKPLTTAIKRLKLEHGELTRVAWNTVNDCLQTTLCLQFKPHYIASGALYLAAKSLNFKLPSSGGKAWWQEFDVSPFQLEEVIKQMFEVLVLSKRPLSLPDTKASSKLVPTPNSLGDREGFSNLCKQSSHLLQNPVGAQVNCESIQKSIARALPRTVASPRRVSDFNTKDGKDGFSSSSDESLNRSLQPVCIEEVKRENMHSSIRPCKSVQSQVQRYASTLLETGIDITKSHEHGLQEGQDINMCRFTEGGGIMAIAGFTGVEERNASEDSVTQPQYSVYDANRPNQCKPPEALETRSTGTQTCVDVSSQYQDAKQYKSVEGNHVWVREEISCVRECSSSGESLHQFQPPFCFEVRADPMQSSVKVSPGSCMLSDVGHPENVVLENGGGCGTSSENGLQQKQDVNPHRRTQHGATLVGDERASVKREVERFSLNLISDIDKERMRTALKRRREERATGQFPAVTKVEDSYDSWIEKELKDGIQLTTPPPMQKARHSHEDFHESWIEKELEGGIELTTQPPKQKARHDDEDIYQSRIEKELEDGIELTNQPLMQKALHHDEDFYESWIEKELEDGIELTTQRPPKQKARHDDADFFESWIEKELEDGIELTIRPSNRKRRHGDHVGLL